MDVIGTKVLRVFLLVFTVTSTSGFYSPPPVEQSCLNLVCNVNIYFSYTSQPLYILFMLQVKILALQECKARVDFVNAEFAQEKMHQELKQPVKE